MRPVSFVYHVNLRQHTEKGLDLYMETLANKLGINVSTA